LLGAAVLKDKHLKMSVAHPASNRIFDAIAFNIDRASGPMLSQGAPGLSTGYQ
jgi:hypothetical protein